MFLTYPEYHKCCTPSRTRCAPGTQRMFLISVSACPQQLSNHRSQNICWVLCVCSMSARWCATFWDNNTTNHTHYNTTTSAQRAHARHDKKYARTEFSATPRFEVEQTWNGGAPAVAQAIKLGILKAFWGGDGIEYVQKNGFSWGREGSVDTRGGVKKAFSYLWNRWGHAS